MMATENEAIVQIDARKKVENSSELKFIFHQIQSS